MAFYVIVPYSSRLQLILFPYMRAYMCHTNHVKLYNDDDELNLFDRISKRAKTVKFYLDYSHFF
jgi:hypothetical protein